MKITPRRILLGIIFGALASVTVFAQSADPLPSWNEGKAKQSFMSFVAKVTRPGSADLVLLAST